MMAHLHENLPCFAYGANLDLAAMRLRAPRSRMLGRAAAPGWRFVIATSGWASIERAEGGVVEGLLWEIHPDDRAALDAFEGLDEGLYQRGFLEVVSDGAARRAWAYVEARGGHGTPDPRYLEGIVAAARRLEFPADRIREIEAWRAR